MTHLSLTGKHWTVRNPDAPLDSLVATLLHARNIEPIGAGEILENIGHDARHFRDFTLAASRINTAIAKRERIAIFGDYDCDGVTSTTLLTRFFRRHGIHPHVRLPHRLKEGYGLSLACVDEFREANITLLLTVDTGVTAVEPVARAREAGIDVLILDHHRLPEVLPGAVAILHPERTTTALDSAPCGAGIAWSTIRGLEELSGHASWEEDGTDLALAAIGTVGDLVELRGGNRTLTHAGLQALSQLREGPLAMLCTHAGLTAPYTSRDIAFRIAPRINAAGRMADPEIALHALLGDVPALLELDTLNRDRQEIVRAHTDALLPLAAREPGRMLCYLHEGYTPGICGLLAGKLCEAHNRPSLVAARAGDICMASLRGIPGYDVTAGLSRCRDLLLSYGGHAMAAGCTFRHDVFDALSARLREDAAAFIREEDLLPVLAADAEIPLGTVTESFVESLSSLEPFGQGNPEPRFLIRDVRLGNPKGVGKDGRHLQATAGRCKTIGFGLGPLMPSIGEPVDLLCKVGIDTWNGVRRPQLMVEDIRPSIRSFGTVAASAATYSG